MKQRLHLARGLIGDAKVLFLDEPTTGMDPLAAREFRTLIGELKGEGRTILLDDARHGRGGDGVRPRDADRPRARSSRPRRRARSGALISRFQRIDVEGAPTTSSRRSRRLAGVASVSPADIGMRIEVNEEGVTADVLRLLVDAGVTSVRTSMPSLEEVYVQMIGDRGLQV